MILQEAREKLKLTQQDVSNELGYGSAQLVSNIERGLCPIPAKHMRQLSKFLKLKVEVMIEYNVERYIARLKREL